MTEKGKMVALSNPTLIEALNAIDNPLRFVARNRYEALGRVKNLEETLYHGVCRLRSLAPHAEFERILDELEAVLPAAGDTHSTRVAQLDVCLELVGELRAGATVVSSSRPELSTSLNKETACKPTSKPYLPPGGLQGKGVGTSVQFIKGVGPRIAQSLGERAISTVGDLLRYLPRRYEDRRTMRGISDLTEGAVATVEGDVRVVNYRRWRGRSTLDVVIGDPTGRLTLKWFRIPGKGFAERFEKGRRLRVSGTVKRYRGNLQMVHPETTLDPDPMTEDDSARSLVPVYPEVEGVRPSLLRTIISRVLPVGQAVDEWLPLPLLARHQLPSWGQSVAALHRPPDDCSLEALERMDTSWHRRLIYEELLLLQLVVLKRRWRAAQEPSVQVVLRKRLGEIGDHIFPFALTGAQQRVLTELEVDISASVPMHRLVQGDVGSGKTAVALAVAAGLAQSGWQSALMAPTEILAEQHARGALQLLGRMGVRVGLLTGQLSAVERRRIVQQIASGEIQVVVGTHALIQQDVHFKKLALGIVDEQHRFGVMQRARFIEQGRESTGCVPHMIVMTATPIPRTLALTVYGDLDVSVIDELPPGRTPIRTMRFREKERDTVYTLVRRAVESGRQAYVVLPLVEESDKEGMEDLRDATSTMEELSSGVLHGITVGLLHGKMNTDDKDRIMRSFAQGGIDVLVATTVIEVGIDVPNATVMVVEHAERFGLSQLHQLRGRVGRGTHQSVCYLLSRYTASEEAWRRLDVMQKTNDGFRIAEEDLAIRGPGDFVGTRQSGLPLLSIANLARDQDLLQAAREDARAILHDDPNLRKPEQQGLFDMLNATSNGRFELAQIG